MQDVLHADWQDVWHSPQPPFFNVFCKDFVFRVLICFMSSGLLLFMMILSAGDQQLKLSRTIIPKAPPDDLWIIVSQKIPN